MLFRLRPATVPRMGVLGRVGIPAGALALNTPIQGTPHNAALAVNGAIATATSTFSTGGTYTPAGAINGDRRGLNWAADGGWNGNNASGSDTLTVTFAQVYDIFEIDVFSIQDAYQNPVEPSLGTTGTLYALKDFVIQALVNGVWTTIETVANNTHIWHRITFTPVAATAIRVVCNGSEDGKWARIVELEAWTTEVLAAVPPVITFQSPTPANGASFIGGVPLSVSAVAYGGQTVASVIFYIDGNVILATLTVPTSSPSTYQFTDSTAPVGVHTYSAKVTDSAGVARFTETRTITLGTALSGNWEARKVDPRVVVKKKLEDPGVDDVFMAAIEGYNHHGVAGDPQGNKTRIFIATDNPPPGSTAFLRILFPSQSQASSGYYFCNFGDEWSDAVRVAGTPYPENNTFGDVGEIFQTQLLWKPSPSWLLDNVRQVDGYSRIGHKVFDIIGGDRDSFTGHVFGSSELGKLVFTHRNQLWPEVYTYNPLDSSQTIGLTAWRTDLYAPGEDDFQPRQSLSQPNLGIYNEVPFVGYTSALSVPGFDRETQIPPAAKGVPQARWMVDEVRVEILSAPTSVRRVCRVSWFRYFADDNASPRERILDWTGLLNVPYKDEPSSPNGLVHGKNGWGKIILFNYLTGKDPTQIHAPIWVDYAQLLVFRGDGALPRVSADATPPAGSWNPTWRSAMTLNSFQSIPGTKPADAVGMRASWDTGGTNYTWRSELFGNSCGIATDETRGWAYAALFGGHSISIWQNGVQGINLRQNIPTWVLKTGSTNLLTDLSDDLYSGPSPGYFASDGHPVSRHTYYSNQVVDISGLPVIICAFTNGTAGKSGGPTSETDAYHIDRTPEPWDVAGTWQTYPGTYWQGQAFTKDPRTGFVWAWDINAEIWYLNTISKAWVHFASVPYGAYRTGSFIDTTRNRFVQMFTWSLPANDGMGWCNLGDATHTAGSHGFQQITGPAVPYVKRLSTWAGHDTVNDKYLLLAQSEEGLGGDCKLFSIHPDTGVSTFVCTAPLASFGDGIDGSAAYIPGLRGVAYYPSFDLDIQFCPLSA